eukprot:tig00021133_g18915.t1
MATQGSVPASRPSTVPSRRISSGTGHGTIRDLIPEINKKLSDEYATIKRALPGSKSRATADGASGSQLGDASGGDRPSSSGRLGSASKSHPSSSGAGPGAGSDDAAHKFAAENERLRGEVEDARSEAQNAWQRYQQVEKALHSQQADHARCLTEYAQHMEQLRIALHQNALALQERDARIADLEAAAAGGVAPGAPGPLDDTRIPHLKPLDLRPCPDARIEEASPEAQAAIELLQRRTRAYMAALRDPKREREAPFVAHEEAVALQAQAAEGRRGERAGAEAGGEAGPAGALRGRYRMTVLHEDGHVSSSLELTGEEREREKQLQAFFEGQIKQLSGQLQASEARCVQFHAECERLAVSLAQSRTDCSMLQVRYDQLQQSHGQLREEYDTTKKNLESQLGVLTEHAVEMQAKMEGLHRSNSRSQLQCPRCKGSFSGSITPGPGGAPLPPAPGRQ